MDENATAAELLAADQPEVLFSTEEAAGGEFRAWAKRWHPDVSRDPEASRVFAHLTALWAEAQRKIAAGEWETPGLLMIEQLRVRYAVRREIEVGELFIGLPYLFYSVRDEFRDLFDRALRTVTALGYATEDMHKECARYLPPQNRVRRRVGDRLYLGWQKSADLILLRDLLTFYGGRVDPRHVAWIVSSLLNLACYLQWSKLAHHGIGLDTYWIAPSNHSGVLLGGWWYATPYGEPLQTVPAYALRDLPGDVRMHKRADGRCDLNRIRTVALELLGELADVPKPMVEWLRVRSAGDAALDYRAWRGVLERSFGPRRFVPLQVSAAELYPMKEKR